MNTKYVILAAFLGLAACTTTGPDSRVSAEEADAGLMTSGTSEVDGMVAQVDAPGEEAAAEDPNAIVCVRERLTGSRIPNCLKSLTTPTTIMSHNSNSPLAWL